MILIDYEFADWNPLATDIAIIFNELTCDNAAPISNFNSGVRFYENNFPSRLEMEFIATKYLRLYFDKVAASDGHKEFETWLDQRLPLFMKEIERCCILVNFNWICAVIMMMKEEEELDPGIFNWEYCRQKAILTAKQREWFGYSAKVDGKIGSDGLLLSETVRNVE